ncbi:MAG TPA: xanthine dehydrogenase family protein molybdopterin-binding subunit [Acidobacteriaceae bacterium]|nr:xanthine dehydrogenase family protein molybdopterin-binding subunit [Acidobacteriaceae bacterium]
MMQEDVQTHPQKQMQHRYDGVSKVTGTAKYAAEFTEPFAKNDLLYGYIVQSTIPSGTVASIDRTAAERSAGVIAVMTPFNAPKVPTPSGPAQPARRSVTVLQNADVYYNGQPIAVVVARSLVEAQHAASLLKIRYNEQPAKLEFRKHLDEARPPKGSGKEPPTNHRGDVAAGMAKATAVVDETYITPIQNHNPMEPHATIAWWDGDKLSVYDATQYISGSKQTLARQFQIPMDNVRVECPNTGGGFGSKGSLWSHATLAAMAAKLVGKPVKVVLGREQMFGPVGARPSTVNHIKLGATADGKLVGIEQDVVVSSSVMEDFVEHSAGVARMLYDSPTLRISEKMVELNIGVGTYQRAPGEAPGTAVLEIAMDELAEKLKMDPLQLRLVNYAEKNPSNDKPWTSKHLREAYTQAADRFGWSKRNAQPGMMREANKLIGYGMGTATYPANRSAAQAVVRILPGGRAFVGSGTQDLGTGMYTMMAQTCADALGLDFSMVDVKLGDSTLPRAPVSGGSQSTASVTPAVEDAAMQAKLKLGELAIAQGASPLHGLKSGELNAKGGSLVHASGKSDTFAAIIERAGGQPVEAMGSAQPAQDREAYSSQSFGAVFAEVVVDVDTHMVQVRRVVATYDIGTLMNNKTGLNQLQGGIVWGVGFALTEETVIDPVYGRTVNENLAEYHVPVNADIGMLDVTVLNIPDTKFNPLGARGIGEIGITGAAAAVANAIYNATGKRVRDYPITPDKLMRA